jgi:5'-deoxynucleotidase YfbR-like HD superfamily hydrolase
MISPVKAAVGPGYGALDDRLAAAIHIRFGLPAQIPKWIKAKIKRADKVSAWLEAVQIAGFSAQEADKFFGKPKPEEVQGSTLHLRPPVEVRAAFTARHGALMEEMG